MGTYGAGSQYYHRSSGLPNPAAYSACGWAYMDWDIGADTFWKFFITLKDGSSKGLKMGVPQTGGNHLAATTFNGSSETLADPSGATPTRNVWFFWAYSNAGSGAGDFKAYCYRLDTDTSLQSASATGYTGFTPTVLQILANDSFSEEWEGGMCGVRIWDAALTQAEFINEIWSLSPIRYSNLNSWYPFLTEDVTDYSGNGYTLTRSGAPTLTGNSPVSYKAITLPPFQAATQQAAAFLRAKGIAKGIIKFR